MKKRLLSRFEKVSSPNDIPLTGTFFILSRTNSFLGKSIQGFMRLQQWLHFTKDTDHVPNHCDFVHDGYAWGALEKGVEKNLYSDHFKKAGDYFIVHILANEREINRMVNFATRQEGKPYRYFDLLRYIWKVISKVWKGKDEKLERDKWTCYSLGATIYEAGTGYGIFGNDLESITPYEFCKVVNEAPDLFE